MNIGHIFLILVIGFIGFFGFLYSSFAANELQVSYGSPTGLEIDDLEAEQISSTDLGNIDVLLAPSPSVPQPKAHNNLHIIFFQPDTRHLINHIDYKILISKDGNEVYS